MKLWTLIAGVATMAIPLEAAQAQPQDVEAGLRRLVEDYREDPNIQDVTFGVEVAGEAWTVAARRPAGGSPASVTLTRGEPQVPTFVWTTDRETFEKLVRGRMSAATAMAQAFHTDVTPLRVRTVHGFTTNNDFSQNVFRPLIFHFWTMGRPEVAPLGFDYSRLVHGGRAVIGAYAPGIRSSWYGILPGDHINADPRSQTDPWTSLFFIIRGGSAQARIGDQVIDLRDNTMIHVPPETHHEFWNRGTVPAEMIMFTFGRNS
jgi:hypothetical protein